MCQSMRRYVHEVANFVSELSDSNLPVNEKSDWLRIEHIQQKIASLLRFLHFYSNEKDHQEIRTIVRALLSRLEILGLTFHDIGNYWSEVSNEPKYCVPSPVHPPPVQPEETLLPPELLQR